jgi:hydrogenase maturation protein HypF
VFGSGVPELGVARRHGERWASVVAVARSGLGAPRTSSAGRLFDAVAAILDVRDTVTYEGQAAVELEQRICLEERTGYRVPVDEAVPLAGVGHALVRCVVDDLQRGTDVGRIAARFHNGLSQAVVDAVAVLRERTGLGTVALSGGVFQNVVLLERVVTGLRRAGLRVLVHHRVPPNDGGISLGQAAVAGARARA